jgi:hypothetical protein
MAPLPKILAGGPAREKSSLVYQAHVEGLQAQADDSLWEMHVRHDVVPDPGGARWQMDKIHRVAQVRQAYFDMACGLEAWVESQPDVLRPKPDFAGLLDAVLMVDTDVILGPGVLKRMWEVDADVVYGVFLTYSDWGGSMAKWPQVWSVQPYGWDQATADALNAPGVNEVEVFGGGACTLIRGRGFESRYWPLLQSIIRLPGMWGGEDRSYGLGLEARGIKQVAVTNLPIHHCYTIADQTKPALERIRQQLGLSDAR